jgi:hypothetical protein
MIGHGVAVSFLIADCVGSREPKVRPSGQEATTKTEALKFGAKLLQEDSPLDLINVYLVVFIRLRVIRAIIWKHTIFVNRLTKISLNAYCSTAILRRLI